MATSLPRTNRSSIDLATAIRELASRCAEEGWQAQAQALLHEAQVLTHDRVTDNNVEDRHRVDDRTRPMTLSVTNLGRFQIVRNGVPLKSVSLGPSDLGAALPLERSSPHGA